MLDRRINRSIPFSISITVKILERIKTARKGISTSSFIKYCIIKELKQRGLWDEYD